MKDLRFIKHDADSYDNDRFVPLLEKEGFEGYGIYWALLENLFGKPGYQAPLTSIKKIAGKLSLHTKHLRRIITDYGLFQITDTHFAAPQLANCRAKMTRHLPTQPTCPTQESAHHPREKTPESEHISAKSEHFSETFCPKHPGNSLKIKGTSDIQEKTREEKEKNTHTQTRESQGEAIAIDAKKTGTQVLTSTETDTPLEQQRIRQVINQIPRQTHWLGNIAKNTSHGKQVVHYLQPLLTEFEAYLCLTAQENTIKTLEDAKRRFFYWSCSQAGKESITRLRQTAAPPQQDIYRYEQHQEGKRTYFGRTIPDDAPPRPTDRAVWDDETREWIL